MALHVGTGSLIFYIRFWAQPNGDLLAYKHTGTADGSASWAYQQKKVGNGWNGFQRVFAGSNGVIYGIQPNGDLLAYKHTGTADGSASWAYQQKKVGNGWNGFVNVFASE